MASAVAALLPPFAGAGRKKPNSIFACHKDGCFEDHLYKECVRNEVGDAHVSRQISPRETQPFPPLVKALELSGKQNATRLHFPGHNSGRAAPTSLTQLIGTLPFHHDFPALPELDNLNSPQGPILEAQLLAAELFGASQTWFLVGGTTCGILAAIMATCCPGDSLILPRNCHVSAISGMVLSGAVPKYMIPEFNCDWGIAGGITPLQVEHAIKELQLEGRKAAAVFVTSPTYHGVCSNLREICRVSHSHDIPVIVDEAHGAHFAFHPEFPEPALHQGVDIAVQSTHKVLCSLTQSSMLHVSGDKVDKERVSACLRTLQSTSPSYLLLASLDAARAQLSDKKDTVFNNALDLATKARTSITNIPGISLIGSSSFSNFSTVDPLRLTVGARELGLSGFEADERLYADQGIVPELVESNSITLTINLGTCEEHIQRLVSGLKRLSSEVSFPILPKASGRMSVKADAFVNISLTSTPREAFFAKKGRVDIRDSVGQVSGELICPYPPGVPLLIPGEIITHEALDYLELVVRQGGSITGASDPELSSIFVCI
uniref:Arginine decarboxylase n=2 Tax=Kalanchoe fedtschenkoi TaxID=63787 RepID=A0A7N0U457_KALFE